jgi:hypothetical protein
LLDRQAGNVSAGPRKRCNEPSADRVSGRGEHNRNWCYRRLYSGGNRVAVGNYHTHLELDEFGGERGDALVLPVCPAVLDRNRLIFGPAEFAQSLHEGGSPSTSRRGCAGTKKADDGRFGPLLRTRT